MNLKLIFKLMVLLVTLEIFYSFISSLTLNFFVTYPKFCTSFTPGPADCSQDYSESSESFLNRYEGYCERNFVSNGDVAFLPRCSCIPDAVRNASFSGTVLYEITDEGIRRPKQCAARQRVAIIIPYRNRKRHLHTLLESLQRLLMKQLLSYKIFVVEQKKPAIFNKAMLMNVGFLEATASHDFDCFIFHDVDMIPADPRNFYVCLDVPRHVGGFVQIYDYKLLYPGLFGAVTAFTEDQFKTVNGFSNQYYGWGGEDDDILQRILSKKMTVNRFPPSVSKYTMILHHSDPGNPVNTDRHSSLVHKPSLYRVDGLNSANYTVEGTRDAGEYAWIYVSLPDPPKSLKTYYRLHSRPDELGHYFRWLLLFIVIVFASLFVICHS